MLADPTEEGEGKSKASRLQIPESQTWQGSIISNGNDNADGHYDQSTKPTPLPKAPMIDPNVEFLGLGGHNGKVSSTATPDPVDISTAEPMRSSAHILSASLTMNGVDHGSSIDDTTFKDIASANVPENLNTAAVEYGKAAPQSESQFLSGGTANPACALDSAGSPLVRPADT